MQAFLALAALFLKHEQTHRLFITQPEFYIQRLNANISMASCSKQFTYSL